MHAKLPRRGTTCSEADALAILGDRHALLVARAIGHGIRRFNEIVASTGAPRDVLTARLRKLERAGVIVRRLYSRRPPRHEYVLTAAGEDLQPILLALKEWGDCHCHTGGEHAVVRHACGAEFHPLTVCAACRAPVDKGDWLDVAGSGEPVAQ